MKRLIFLTILMLGLSTALQKSTPMHANTGLFNMSYLFFGVPNSYLSQVNKTQGSLNVVSPNYFDIAENGELEVTWTLNDSFINEMKKRGIKVVPFLANHWNKTAGINGLKKREQLATSIAEAIKTYHLDGVNVDIEGVSSDFRDEHTDFIRLLRKKIPDNKEVSVAVAANPNNWSGGWHGFYDYKGLSDHCDYLMIMAYDESWESPESPIGPVSSISFFERSIKYALNQGVPKDKIVAGLPFYGRMWKTDGPTLENKKINGMGVSSSRIKSLTEEYNGTVKFDEKTQSPMVSFKIPKGQDYIINKTKLTQGEYVIWYENEQSIKAKLLLPKKYGIKGTGSWALQHELPEMWHYYSLWLNKQFFVDLTASFSWAQKSIDLVSEKGWMHGTTSTTFSPGSTLTRAQGAVILVRALGKANKLPDQYQFTDTKGHWAQKEIEVARELGYVNGKEPNKFDPNAPLKRQELAQILYNIFSYPIPDTENPFQDIQEGQWSYNAVQALAQKGFISGYDDGTFRPNETSKRAHMAALMERMSKEFETKANAQ
ncbi:glycosyl hydrolase family 18 protein [Bacillus tuaregi]|uniref:glycosyl hydrolase family 18 protein n=1 Tax=Bacillus tuaregi TaxID=1816695 RepID=UPI000A04D181|nr:glycosyl hydrolase family 18 protein [Bacillus tuaregi]